MVPNFITAFELIIEPNTKEFVIQFKQTYPIQTENEYVQGVDVKASVVMSFNVAKELGQKILELQEKTLEEKS